MLSAARAFMRHKTLAGQGIGNSASASARQTATPRRSASQRKLAFREEQRGTAYLGRADRLVVAMTGFRPAGGDTTSRSSGTVSSSRGGSTSYLEETSAGAQTPACPFVKPASPAVPTSYPRSTEGRSCRAADVHNGLALRAAGRAEYVRHFIGRLRTRKETSLVIGSD